MPIDITMPALSPTMETGTLAKWLVKVGDAVKSGDVLAEIETDKATMEVESIDEGEVAEILVAEGTEEVKVGAIIARLTAEGEAAAPAKRGSAADDQATTARTDAPPPPQPVPSPPGEVPAKPTQGVATGNAGPQAAPAQPAATTREAEGDLRPDAGRRDERRAGDARDGVAPGDAHGEPAGGHPARADGDRINASPLARRLASAAGLDLAALSGSGPHGRIVKADIDAAAAQPARRAADAASSSPRREETSAPPASRGGEGEPRRDAPRAEEGAAAATPSAAAQPAAAAGTLPPPAGVPMEAVKLSNMRKTIARRLAESKATVPHFYLTVDVRLDALLKLRGDLNRSLEAAGIKLSVNDLLIKALGLALVRVPDANVQFAGSELYRFGRADVSVAVAIPGGLITPVIVDAANKRPSVIATEMKDLAARAKDGKLKPEEYQGGTASLSNLGMFGIKQFDAVINPPQGLILAVGAGEKRPVVDGDALAVATVMSATGSFDHRAIDGAVGAQFMAAFKALVEAPMTMLA